MAYCSRLSFNILPMMSSRPKQEKGVAVFLLKGRKVLLGRRRRSAIASDTFCIPGGHLEIGESCKDCAIREVKEETGLDIKNIEVVKVFKNIVSEPTPVELVGVYMRAVPADPDQEPINAEPEKCDGWNWYDWDDLPSPLFGLLQTQIQQGLNPFQLN